MDVVADRWRREEDVVVGASSRRLEINVCLKPTRKAMLFLTRGRLVGGN